MPLQTWCSATTWTPPNAAVVDSQRQVIHIEHFRAYGVARAIDVRMAVTAVQQAELFPHLSTIERSNVGTIISELGTNILKYACSGRILLRAIRCGERRGIEVLAIDDGPGIADIRQAMQDHFTTGRTLGLGLGAVQRLASTFELHCPAGGGTHARAICWSGDQEKSAHNTPTTRSTAPADPRVRNALAEASSHEAPLLLRSLMRNRPALGERLSGDTMLVLDHGPLSFRVVIDGTGHGPIAHGIAMDAAAAIEQALMEQVDRLDNILQGEFEPNANALDELMRTMIETAHRRIRGSRGAAVGMAAIDGRRRQLHFLGIGNTRILHLGYGGWEGVNRDGQLGVGFRPPTIQHFAIQPGDVVIQASDGIRTSTLRAMRARRPDASLNLETITNQLLSRSSFDDDVSVLVSQCHI